MRNSKRTSPPAPKMFSGQRKSGGAFMPVLVNGKPLSPRVDVLCYSKEFDWGNTSKGALQLAAAILCSVFDEKTALECHHAFAREVVQHMQRDDWLLSEEAVRRWIEDRREGIR